MENLSESVFECTLAVEAHMICDLLARAGISSRVDGEFLAGAGGELPLGSSIKVRVHPSRAAEARAAIDEWEKAQPPPEALSTPRPRSQWRSPLWFLAGLVVGGGLMVFGLRTPYQLNATDFDQDGINDEFYYYRGQVPSKVEFDRNADREIDARTSFDLQGVVAQSQSDDDFNGTFEWQQEFERGQIVRASMDLDGDGRPERVEKIRHGVLQTIEIYGPSVINPVVRETYDNSRLVVTEYDKNWDGVFERRVEHDEFGEPKPSSR